MKTHTFRTYANKNALIATFGGMALLLVCIVLPALLTPTEEIRFSWFGLIPAAIFLFFIYVILASFLKLFITFNVSDEGIMISKPLFHRRFIPAGEIKEIIMLDEEKTRAFMENEVMYQQGIKDSGEVSNLFQKIKKESPYYKYLTITPGGTSAGTNQAETVTSVNMDGEMVLLLLKNGEKFFLSPREIGTFYNLISKIIKG